MEMSIEHYYTELLKCSVGVLLKEGSIPLNNNLRKKDGMMVNIKRNILRKIDYNFSLKIDSIYFQQKCHVVYEY